MSGLCVYFFPPLGGYPHGVRFRWFWPDFCGSTGSPGRPRTRPFDEEGQLDHARERCLDDLRRLSGLGEELGDNLFQVDGAGEVRWAPAHEEFSELRFTHARVGGILVPLVRAIPRTRPYVPYPERGVWGVGSGAVGC